MNNIYMVMVDASFAGNLKHVGISPTLQNMHFVKCPSADIAKRVVLGLYRQDLSQALLQCLNVTLLDNILGNISDQNYLWTYVRKEGSPKLPGQQGVLTKDIPAFATTNDLRPTQAKAEKRIETTGEVRPSATEESLIPALDVESLIIDAPPAPVAIVEAPAPTIETDSSGNIKLTAQSLQDIISAAVKQAVASTAGAASTTIKSGKVSIDDLEKQAGQKQMVPIYDESGNQIGTELLTVANSNFQTNGIPGLLTNAVDAETMQRIRKNIKGSHQSQFTIVNDF